VITHLTIGMDNPMEAIAHLFQHFKPQLPVFVLQKNSLLTISL
jgi:hypothetical protein